MNVPFGGRKKQQPIPRRRLDQVPRHDATGAAAASSAASAERTVFRRNRTLTGTTSQSVRSTSELTATMQSPRATAHHLRRKRRRLGLLLIAGLASALGIGLLLQQFTADVKVAVVGQVRPLTQAQQNRIIEPIESYLSTRPLERFRLLLNKDNLHAYLQDQGVRDIEYIQDLAMDGIGGSVLRLKVREPVARWSIGGQERFVDKSGAVFAVNYFDTPTVTIRDESGISTRSEAEAQAVTSSRFLAFIGQTVGLLSRYDLGIESVVIPPGTTRHVNLVIAGDQSTPVKMTIDRPAGQQAEDAMRAYRHLAGQGVSARYIDVRVSGMAFYR